jgi:hypothetical protein
MTLVQVPLSTTHVQVGGKPSSWPAGPQIVGFGGTGPNASGTNTASMATGWAPDDVEFAFSITLGSASLADPGGSWAADPTAVISSTTYQQWHRRLQTGDTGFVATPSTAQRYTLTTMVLRGVDTAQVLETVPETFGSQSQLHWGRGGREATLPNSVYPSNGDKATIAGCLQVFVFANPSASKTVDWSRVDAVQQNSRTNGTGPQIIVATHLHPFADYVGANFVISNATGNVVLTQFMVRPAS